MTDQTEADQMYTITWTCETAAQDMDPQQAADYAVGVMQDGDAVAGLGKLEVSVSRWTQGKGDEALGEFHVDLPRLENPHVVIVGTKPTTAMDNPDDAGYDVLGPYSKDDADAVARLLEERLRYGDPEEPFGQPFVDVRPLGKAEFSLAALHRIADNWVEER